MGSVTVPVTTLVGSHAFVLLAGVTPLAIAAVHLPATTVITRTTIPSQFVAFFWCTALVFEAYVVPAAPAILWTGTAILALGAVAITVTTRLACHALMSPAGLACIALTATDLSPATVVARTALPTKVQTGLWCTTCVVVTDLAGLTRTILWTGGAVFLVVFIALPVTTTRAAVSLAVSTVFTCIILTLTVVIALPAGPVDAMPGLAPDQGTCQAVRLVHDLPLARGKVALYLLAVRVMYHGFLKWVTFRARGLHALAVLAGLARIAYATTATAAIVPAFLVPAIRCARGIRGVTPAAPASQPEHCRTCREP